MEKIREILAERIKSRRKEIGVNQEELAESAGISIGMVKNVETGKKWVSPETIEAIADALNVPPSELFNDISSMAISPSEALKMLLILPDDIVKGLYQCKDRDRAWEDIRKLIKGYKLPPV